MSLRISALHQSRFLCWALNSPPSSYALRSSAASNSSASVPLSSLNSLRPDSRPRPHPYAHVYVLTDQVPIIRSLRRASVLHARVYIRIRVYKKNESIILKSRVDRLWFFLLNNQKSSRLLFNHFSNFLGKKHRETRKIFRNDGLDKFSILPTALFFKKRSNLNEMLRTN